MQLFRLVTSLVALSLAACGAVEAETCTDGAKNGAETDVDCGGFDCARCFDGKACTFATDCVNGSCIGGRCTIIANVGGGGGATGGGSAATGGGSATTGGGSAVTGGGSAATGGGSAATGGGSAATGGGSAATGGGSTATGGGSAATGGGSAATGGGSAATGGGSAATGGGAGATTLVLSQLQTRGSTGGNDEFVEIANVGVQPVTFDSTWTVTARTATSCTGNEAVRYTGKGQVIPPGRHLLLVNSGYDGATLADDSYFIAISDASSLLLRHDGALIDALCTWADPASLMNLTTCAPAFTCAGTPVQNPHDNTTSTNTDQSLLRRGNTGDSAADFMSSPAVPRNLATP